MLLIGGDRVMNQVMYPIWIWELYLATGDIELIRRHRDPLLRCLNYIATRTTPDGVVNQVDRDDWQLSEGADWVDWSPERMEGSTCVYHTWYARALAHCVQIFRLVGDSKSVEMAQAHYHRQRSVLDTLFWNGDSYCDNLNFNGQRVANFWCDSQIWPIGYGFASKDQAATIFARIGSEPELFEGMPMRWCPPLTDEQSHNSLATIPMCLRNRIFGRMPGLVDSAPAISSPAAPWDNMLMHKLLERYCQSVVKYQTCMECLDMQGNIQTGTSGGRDYLEHAGGLLLATGRGLWGIDDTTDGTLVWKPSSSRAHQRASTVLARGALLDVWVRSGQGTDRSPVRARQRTVCS